VLLNQLRITAALIWRRDL